MSQDNKHMFDSYPFPKHLAADLKFGHYKITSKDGSSEIVQGNNAKDALGKATIGPVDKLEYLGFYSKTILSAEEVIEQPNPPVLEDAGVADAASNATSDAISDAAATL